MLGQGCIWKDQCKCKKTAFMKKNYCDSDAGWRDCPHTVGNSGNKEAQKKFNYAKASDSNSRLGQYVIAAIIVLTIICKFFL